MWHQMPRRPLERFAVGISLPALADRFSRLSNLPDLWAPRYFRCINPVSSVRLAGGLASSIGLGGPEMMHRSSFYRFVFSSRERTASYNSFTNTVPAFEGAIIIILRCCHCLIWIGPCSHFLCTIISHLFDKSRTQQNTTEQNRKESKETLYILYHISIYSLSLLVVSL
jgi:hypothetical protein